MRSQLRDWVDLKRLRELVSSSLYRNAYYIMVSQALMAFLGFFFWVIVARFYTEAEVGYSGAIISAMGLVALTGQLGLGSFLVRFLSGSQNKAVVVNTCLTYTATVTAVAAVICVIGLGIFPSRIGFIAHQPAFFVAFVAFAVATSLFSMSGAAFVAHRHAEYMVAKDLVFSVLKLFLPLLFVSYFHAFGIVASWGLATLGGVMLSLYVLLPRIVRGYMPRPHLGARLVRRAWGYSGMSYIVSLIANAPTFLMPLMVINALGPIQNGYFYVAWAIYTVLSAIPGSISQSMFAEAAWNRRTLHQNIIRSFMLAFALVVPAVLFLELCGGRLLLAFGASYSENSACLLQVLAPAVVPVTVVKIHFAALRVMGRMRELLAIRTALTVIVLAAAYLLLAGHGITIIGWIYVVTHSVAAIAIVVLRSRLWSTPDGGA